MQRIAVYVALMNGTLIVLTGADFYSNSGFTAYTWPGLVLPLGQHLTSTLTQLGTIHCSALGIFFGIVVKCLLSDMAYLFHEVLLITQVT